MRPRLPGNPLHYRELLPELRRWALPPGSSNRASSRGRRAGIRDAFVTGFAHRTAFKGISDKQIIRKSISAEELMLKLSAALTLDAAAVS
jgi:hypothetical protein